MSIGPKLSANSASNAAPAAAFRRMRSQNGSTAASNRNDGKKIAIVATSAPKTPWTGVPFAAPRKLANVNNGPGTTWATP